MAFSDFMEDEIVDIALRGGSWTVLATSLIHVALYTTTQNDANGGTEVTGGNYARQNVTNFSAPAGGDGITKNPSLIRFPASGNAGADWGQVGWWGILKHLTNSAAADLLFWGEFPVKKQVFSDDHVEIPANSLIITLE